MEKIIDNELISLIDKDEFAGFGVGLHGIGEDRGYSEKGKSKLEIARGITEKGIKLGHGYSSINGNVFAIGILKKDNENIANSLWNYNWGEGMQTNVLVVYPPIVQNSNGERLYLGYTNAMSGGSIQDTPCSFMDEACSNLGYVPKEFILGYYMDTERKYGEISENEHITYDFERNPNFCGSCQISDELYNELFNSLRPEFQQLSVACASAIDKSDISSIEKMIEYYKKDFNNWGLTKDVKMLESILEDIRARIERKIQQDKSQKIDILDDNLLDLLSGCEGYNIALHVISPKDIEEMSNTQVAQSILQNGIEYNEYYTSINGMARCIGVKGKDDKQIKRLLQNYKIAGTTQTNAIVVYPPIIENSKGEKLYLGHTDPDAGKDIPTSFMDYTCGNLLAIPKEFILGYYVDKERKYGTITEGEHIDYEFVRNPNYCQGSKVDDKLFERIAEQLGDFKSISEECAKALESKSVSKLFDLMISKIGFLKALGDENVTNLFFRTFKEIQAQIPTQRLTSDEIKKVAEDRAVILENSNAQSVINESQHNKDKAQNNGIRGV